MANKLFTTIPAPKLKRNTFNLSNQVSLTMSFNKLYPSRTIEVIPGDIMSVGAEIFSRLQPMMAPVLNSMKVKVNAFYVPFRTINHHFAEFMFNNKDGNYDEVMPYCTLYTPIIVLHEAFLYNWTSEQEIETYADWKTFTGLTDTKLTEILNMGYRFIELFRYFGIPYNYSSFSPASSNADKWGVIEDFYNDNQNVSHLRMNLSPFIAYEKVWNEYYRDENLVGDIFDEYKQNLEVDLFDLVGKVEFDDFGAVNWSSTVDLLRFFQLRPKAWAHDRFTSCLPFAQRGPDVSIPIQLDGKAPVFYDGSQNYGYLPTSKQAGVLRPLNSSLLNRDGLSLQNRTSSPYVGAAIRAYPSVQSAYDVDEIAHVNYDPGDTLKVDLTSQDVEFTSTIRDFRRALRLQQWYENSARGGYRPNEATLAHFGVSVPDQSLDRAEFLGGYSSDLVVSEIPQTGATGSGSTPQGTLAGKGTQYGASHLFKHFFTEHGFIILMTACTARANYYQGLDRMFSRMTRDDYAWPEFANLGEEPVYVKELYVDNAGNTTDDETVFGYLPRYSDYKSAVNKILGDFTEQGMKMWVQPREFANEPKLNKEFIYDSAPLSPFVVQDGTDVILSVINFSVKASRLLPFYGVPTL